MGIDWNKGEMIYEGGYYLYAHMNPSNKKVYIGIAKNYKERWKQKERSYKRCPKIYAAFQKYGWDHFEHVIIYDKLTEEARDKEKLWVWAYKELGLSYNIADGGQGGLGVPKSPELRKRISEWLTGRVCSEETRRKISESHKKLHNFDIKIYAFDKLTGKQVMAFSSIREAERSTGVLHTNISANAKGKVISAGSYIWDYKPFIEKDDFRLLSCIDKAAKSKVYCYDLRGNYVITYPTARAAAKAVGADPCTIGECCSKHRLSCKGFIWRRALEPIEKDVLDRINKWRTKYETDKS